MNKMESAVFYQIFPLGMLGAEWDNEPNGQIISRIPNLKNWIPHVTKLGANAIYLSPIFESDHHGYDTRDYFKIDRRLGSNEEFKQFVEACHAENISVVLDGVFNHVGRGFWAFKDVLEKREQSQYTSWFHINFQGNSNYNDGFWYEGWEGHFELVKLNLDHPDVRRHLLDAVNMWMDEFKIDGLRLDVAYMLHKGFMGELCGFCRGKNPEFWLVGEALHGYYKTLMDGGLLDSVTNYECYKGLYSSFNSKNMFEIASSLNRQFGQEQWTLYKGRHLFNFVDNHDVTRIASILENKNHLPLIYALLFTMPGIPCVYNGSEWGIYGGKRDGDGALRPYLQHPEWNELTEHIAKLAVIHKKSKALTHGEYKQLQLSNSQIVFERSWDGDRVIIAMNLDDHEYVAHFDARAGCGTDLMTESHVDFGGGLRIPPYTALVIQV